MIALDGTVSHLIHEDEGNEPELEAVVSTPPQERIDYATYKLTIVGKEWILDLCDFSSTSVLHRRGELGELSLCGIR